MKKSEKEPEKQSSPQNKDKVGEVMHEFKEGELRSGRSDKKVTDRKQAIAIALSEAREEDEKDAKKSKSTSKKNK